MKALQQSNEKREQFYIEIKTRSKRQLLAKLRFHNRDQQINNLAHLIDAKKGVDCNNEIKLMLGLVRNNISTAIVHLGNLAIDGHFKWQHVEPDINWLSPQQNEYFEWLLWVLLQRDFLINSKIIIDIFANFFLEGNVGETQYRQLYTLKCLNLILNKKTSQFYHQIFSFLPNVTSILHRLVDFCIGEHEEIGKESWKLMSKILSQEQDELENDIVEELGLGRMKKLIKFGLLSMNIRTRALACQILNNSLTSLAHIICTDFHSELGEILQKVLFSFQSESEKVEVRIEMAYLLLNMAEFFHYPDLKWMIDRGMIESLRACSENKQICRQAIETIFSRMEGAHCLQAYHMDEE